MFGISVYAFGNRTINGPTPLLKGGDGSIQIMTASGDVYTVSGIKFVDKNNNPIITINAGPPPVIDITDDKGKVRSINLRKLADNARWFGGENE